MTTHLPPSRRCGLAVFVLAMLAGAGAPLAATLPDLIARMTPPTEPEIRRTLVIACPLLPDREPGDRAAPWLSRCGLPR